MRQSPSAGVLAVLAAAIVERAGLLPGVLAGSLEIAQAALRILILEPGASVSVRPGFFIVALI